MVQEIAGLLPAEWKLITPIHLMQVKEDSSE